MVLLFVTGCGFGKQADLVVSSDGKAVVQDALDGRLDQGWSCGSLRRVVDRLPRDLVYSTIARTIGQAAGRRCSEALADVHSGMSRASVRSTLGQPDRTPRCWIYGWPTASKSSVAGARICFANGRARSFKSHSPSMGLSACRRRHVRTDTDRMGERALTRPSRLAAGESSERLAGMRSVERDGRVTGPRDRPGSPRRRPEAVARGCPGLRGCRGLVSPSHPWSRRPTVLRRARPEARMLYLRNGYPAGNNENPEIYSMNLDGSQETAAHLGPRCEHRPSGCQTVSGSATRDMTATSTSWA